MYGKRLGGCRPGMMMHGAKKKLFFLWLMKKLDLSDEQRDCLRTIFLDAKKEGIRKWADARVAHVEVMQTLLQKDMDRGRVEDAVRNVGGKFTELGLVKVRALLDAIAVLNDNQRAKLRGMLPPGGCPMCGHKGGWGGMMGAHGMPGMDVEEEEGEEEGEEEEEE